MNYNVYQIRQMKGVLGPLGITSDQCPTKNVIACGRSLLYPGLPAQILAPKAQVLALKTRVM